MPDSNSLKKAARRLIGAAIAAAACALPFAAYAASGAVPSPDKDAPNAPTVEITNGIVTAQLYLPDAEHGYYRATRFDWSGAIAKLEVNGHSYFGRWFAAYDPKKHDAITGPVQEFVTGQGYAEAKPGTGTFVKIGVGVLRKPDPPIDRGFPTLEIVDGGKWTTKVQRDSVEFTHEVRDPVSGYGYRYRKIVSLPAGKAQLVLTQHIESTGEHPIDTEMYDHNFFVIDNQPSGPDFSVTFPFAVTARDDLKGFVNVQGNSLTYAKPIVTPVRSALFGFGVTPADYAIQVENRATGAGVRVTSDQPLSNLVFWSSSTTVCPEAYIRVHAERGRPMDWKISYDFYAK